MKKILFLYGLLISSQIAVASENCNEFYRIPAKNIAKALGYAVDYYLQLSLEDGAVFKKEMDMSSADFAYYLKESIEKISKDAEDEGSLQRFCHEAHNLYKLLPKIGVSSSGDKEILYPLRNSELLSLNSKHAQKNRVRSRAVTLNNYEDDGYETDTDME